MNKTYAVQEYDNKAYRPVKSYNDLPVAFDLRLAMVRNGAKKVRVKNLKTGKVVVPA